MSVLKLILKIISPDAGISFCKAYFTLHRSLHLKPPFSHLLCMVVTHRQQLQDQAIGELPNWGMISHSQSWVHIQSHSYLCQIKGCGFIVQFLMQRFWPAYYLGIRLLIFLVWINLTNVRIFSKEIIRLLLFSYAISFLIIPEFSVWKNLHFSATKLSWSSLPPMRWAMVWNKRTSCEWEIFPFLSF